MERSILYCGVCKEEYPVTAEKTLISTGHAQSIGHLTGTFESFVRNAAHDATNKKILEKCKKEGCGLNYMTIVFVGTEKKATFVCKCKD